VTKRFWANPPIRTLAASLAAVLLLVLLVAGAVGCGSGGDDSSAMATVGSVSITQAEFNKRLAEFEAEYAGQIPDKYSDPDGYKDFQQSVLEYLVRVEIVNQKASALSISVTDADVSTQIEQIKTQNFSGDQTAFDEALKAQNMTLTVLQTRIKEQLLMQAAYNAVTKDLTTVPEAEVQAYYDANKADYYTDETRQARHILISPSALAAADASTTATDPSTTTTTAAPTEADWAAAKAKADEVRAEIVGGLDFADAAKKYSDDPGSKEVGGELGTFGKGEMVAAFDDSVFSLAKDEISQPIKTEYGYHIIQVEAINAAHEQTLDEVKDEITSNLVQEAQGTLWDNWMTQAKAELNVTYKEGMEITTTTLAPVDASTTPTTSGPTDTSTTGTTNTPTSSAPTTTTTVPESTTTVPPATTTTTG
jgi:parvulin-like peptidyl-prolyl isomerase